MGRVVARVKRVSGRVPNPNFRRALYRANSSMSRLALTDARRRAGDAVRTGDYLSSITSVVMGREGFSIESDVPQAWYLEFGTGRYGPKKRDYWIRPKPSRAYMNQMEYLSGKSRKEATGVWPEGIRKTPHSYLKWMSGGRPIYAMEVLAPGMRPEPNLWPAIIENADAMEGIIETNIVRAWARG